MQLTEEWLCTPTDVCPDLVPVDTYGHHRSEIGMHKGQRVRKWKFETWEKAMMFQNAWQRGEFRRKAP